MNYEEGEEEELDLSLGIMSALREVVKKEEKRTEGIIDTYHASCPQCGRRQIREFLIKNGCWVCGWKETPDRE
ncbi:MAG: hypothetical protein ACE5Z5_00785 [Candidatus Bathyarchaeia archaeon]